MLLVASEARPYTPGQVADLFNVSIQSVAAWANEGLIPHFRTPKGKRRFPRAEIDALVAAQGGKKNGDAA